MEMVGLHGTFQKNKNSQHPINFTMKGNIVMSLDHFSTIITLKYWITFSPWHCETYVLQEWRAKVALQYIFWNLLFKWKSTAHQPTPPFLPHTPSSSPAPFPGCMAVNTTQFKTGHNTRESLQVPGWWSVCKEHTQERREPSLVLGSLLGSLSLWTKAELGIFLDDARADALYWVLLCFKQAQIQHIFSSTHWRNQT